MTIPAEVMSKIEQANHIAENAHPYKDWAKNSLQINKLVYDIVVDAIQQTDYDYTEQLIEVLPPCLMKSQLIGHHNSFKARYVGYYSRQTKPN
jgi:hypothetical protein